MTVFRLHASAALTRAAHAPVFGRAGPRDVRPETRLITRGNFGKPRRPERSNIIAHNTTERRQRGDRSLGVPLWARRLSSALLSSENFTPPRWRPEKGLPARLHLSDCRSRMRPTPSKPCALSPPPPHQPRHICSTPSNLVARWPPRHGCAVPATWPACLAASARCWRSYGARGWDG